MAEQSINEPDTGAADTAATGLVERPRVDILETDQEVMLLADLPGVRPNDVDVRFENGELTIHGRRTPTNAGKRRVLWEFEPAHYHRVFRLTEDVAADRIDANSRTAYLRCVCRRPRPPSRAGLQ